MLLLARLRKRGSWRREVASDWQSVYLVRVSMVVQKEACSDTPGAAWIGYKRAVDEVKIRETNGNDVEWWRKMNCQRQDTRMCFVTHQQVFALKCVNALVEDYPPSNWKCPLQHKGAGRNHFLHPCWPANGPGLLQHLRRSQNRYDETELLASSATNMGSPVRLNIWDWSGGNLTFQRMRSDASRWASWRVFFALINSLRMLTFSDSRTLTVKTFVGSSLRSRELSVYVDIEGEGVTIEM